MLPLFANCGGDDGDEPSPKPQTGQQEEKDPNTTDDETVTFSFTGSLNKMTSRATETTFDSGDAISIYAVKKSGNITLLNTGNYADNRRYSHNGTMFSSTNAVSIERSDVDQLAFYAIYPYSSSNSANMTFTAKADQSTAANLTASDFSTAYSAPSTSIQPQLKFDHRMANLRLQLQGNLGNSVSVTLVNVYASINANINDNTFTATGGKSDIKMYNRGNGLYEAFLAPQLIAAQQYCFDALIDGQHLQLYFENDQTLQSGYIYSFTYDVSSGKTEQYVVVDGHIHEWYY